MNLKTQKRIAAQLLKVGQNRVWFDPDRLTEIKEAITKADIRSLIGDLAIQKKPEKGISKFRARKLRKQKRKGRRKSEGSRKGRRKARLPRKKSWVSKVRTQRNFIKTLKDKEIIAKKTYRALYKKIAGNFFRTKRHIKLYLEENKLFIKKAEKK